LGGGGGGGGARKLWDVKRTDKIMNKISAEDRSAKAVRKRNIESTMTTKADVKLQFAQLGEGESGIVRKKGLFGGGKNKSQEKKIGVRGRVIQTWFKRGCANQGS